ncbi:hypothetical protein C8R46DRAFT_1209728 [Mycena filopes]|nr:hypothetical protein C8R46DRAFT_1209728 [Mycena filopes]
MSTAQVYGSALQCVLASLAANWAVRRVGDVDDVVGDKRVTTVSGYVGADIADVKRARFLLTSTIVLKILASAARSHSNVSFLLTTTIPARFHARPSSSRSSPDLIAIAVDANQNTLWNQGPPTGNDWRRMCPTSAPERLYVY